VQRGKGQRERGEEEGRTSAEQGGFEPGALTHWKPVMQNFEGRVKGGQRIPARLRGTARRVAGPGRCERHPRREKMEEMSKISSGKDHF